MSITDWPLNERPCEKLRKLGANSLSEAELLAIFIKTGIKGRTAVDLARDLLLKFGTLSNVFRASEQEIISIQGLGPVKFTLLQAVLELGRRYLEENITQKKLNLASRQDAEKYLFAKLVNQDQEIFSCLFLDTQHRILKYEELFYGTIDRVPIYPRIIAQKALKINASALILAHNHPSGDVKPSSNDLEMTRKLISVLTVLNIRILDHIIIGRHRCLSLIQGGLI